MANTIDIVVQAHDRASKQLAAVGNRADRLADKLRKMRGPLLAVTAAIGGLGFFAVKTFAGFEHSMARVGAVSGATAKELGDLTEIAQEMGRTTMFTAKQSAEALTFMAMAGMNAKTQIEALPQVLNLAAAGALDLGSAADIVTNVMAGFGLRTDELAMANDVLTTAFTSANTDLRGLGSAFKMAGPVAKAAGLSFNETAASLALLGNAGLQGSLAGTALRGAITRLLNPTGEAAKIIRELGLNATDAQGNLVSMVDIVQQLETSGITAGQAMQVFGLRAGPAMLALVSQGSDSLVDLIEKMEDSAGVAKDIAEEQMNTLWGKMIELKSAVEGVAIAFGKEMKPAIEGMAILLTEVARGMTDVNPVALQMGAAVMAIVAAIAVLGLIAPPIIAVVGALFSVGGLVAAGIAGFIAFIGAMYHWRDEVGKVTGHVIKSFLSVIPMINGFDDVWSKRIDNLIDKMIEFDEFLYGGIGKSIKDFFIRPDMDFMPEHKGALEAKLHMLAEAAAAASRRVHEVTEEIPNLGEEADDAVPKIDELTNSFRNLRNELSAIDQLFQDPVRGYASLNVGPGASFMGLKTDAALIAWKDAPNRILNDRVIAEAVVEGDRGLSKRMEIYDPFFDPIPDTSRPPRGIFPSEEAPGSGATNPGSERLTVVIDGLEFSAYLDTASGDAARRREQIRG